MINFRNAATVLALSLAVMVATPAMAKSAARPGHDARAQAIQGDVVDGISVERANALRECSAIANRFDQKTWGVYQGAQMRACMNQHGEPE